MNGIYYSASRAGFFHEGLHDEIPEDAVPIPARRHAELMDAQSAGARIVANDKGRPVIEHATAAERRAQLVARVQREASRRILAVSPVWRQLNDMRSASAAGAARFASIDAIRLASDRIVKMARATGADALDAFQVADHPDWPEGSAA